MTWFALTDPLRNNIDYESLMNGTCYFRTKHDMNILVSRYQASRMYDSVLIDRATVLRLRRWLCDVIVPMECFWQLEQDNFQDQYHIIFIVQNVLFTKFLLYTYIWCILLIIVPKIKKATCGGAIMYTCIYVHIDYDLQCNHIRKDNSALMDSLANYST